MDIQKIITELVEKFGKDSDLKEKFKKDPVGTVKSLVKDFGITDDQIQDIVKAVSAKLKLDGVKDALGSLGSLFGK